MTTIVEGKKIAEKIKEEIIENLKISKPKSLAIFYVGEDRVIDSYVSLKKRLGETLGVNVSVFKFPKDILEELLIEQISEANNKFSGVMVQLPLPKNLNRKNILDAIDSDVDVDILSTKAYEDFKNSRTLRLPPVVAGVKEIIDEHNINLNNKKIVVIGRGLLVGQPICDWLDIKNYPYESFDDKSLGLNKALLSADVIISGTGVPSLVNQNMIKDGVVLIDVGTSSTSGKIVGDIEKSCYEKASIVAGVPGGVGPIAVVSLFRNLFLK